MHAYVQYMHTNLFIYLCLCVSSRGQAELFFSRLAPHDPEMAATIAYIMHKRPGWQDGARALGLVARAALRTELQSAHVLMEEALLLLQDVGLGMGAVGGI